MREHSDILIFAGAIVLIVLMGRFFDGIGASSRTVSTKAEVASAANQNQLLAIPTSSLPSFTGREPVAKVPEVSFMNPDLERATTSAQEALVVDLIQGVPFLSFNAEGRWPIASITKLMTALIALERFPEDQMVRVSERAVLTEAVAGGLKAGELYSLADMVRILLLTSSNDAAVALSEVMPPGEFVAAMNQKTQELGMMDTSYFDPMGLSPLNQSTPKDLSKLATFIWQQRPDLLAVTRMQKATVRAQGARQKRTILNIDTLAGRADFLGGKTGYIEEADRNLFAVFSFNARPVLVVVLGADDHFGETERLWNLYKAHAR